MVGKSGALRLIRDPTNAGTVVGATAVASRTPIDTPSGSESTVTATVLRSMRRVTEEVRPVLSRTVRVSSKYDGGWWSGTVKVAPATSDHIPIPCSWQTVA